MKRLLGQDVLDAMPSVLLQAHVFPALCKPVSSFAGMYRLASDTLSGKAIMYGEPSNEGWLGLIWLEPYAPAAADVHIAWSRKKDPAPFVEQAKPLAKAEGFTQHRLVIPKQNRAANMLAKRTGFMKVSEIPKSFPAQDGSWLDCNLWFLEVL